MRPCCSTHHEPEETYYSGQWRMQIDGRESALGPGSAVFIPSNARHAVQRIGPEPLVFVFAFARDRSDQVVYHFDARDLPVLVFCRHHAPARDLLPRKGCRGGCASRARGGS